MTVLSHMLFFARRQRYWSDRAVSLLLITVLASCSSRALSQTNTRILTVDALTEASDIVLVGRVVQVSQVSETHVQLQHRDIRVVDSVADIEVQDVLKGSVQSTHIIVRTTDTYDPAGGLPPALPSAMHGCRIMFLRRLSSDFEFTAKFRATLPAICGIHNETDTPLASVVHEVLAVLESMDASTANKLDALGSLFHVEDSSISAGLRTCKCDNGNPVLHVQLLAERLRRNDVDALPEAILLLSKRESNKTLPYLLSNLDYAIRDGMKSADATGTLVPLLRSRNVEDRRAAASALRNIGTNESLDALKPAIFDSDLDVQYYAVLGLATLAGDREWLPNAELFRTEHAKYISYWREWAKNH